MPVSKNHNIGKDTGTMLTPTHRELTDKYPDDIMLVMYKLTGKTKTAKGKNWDDAPWNGQPFWMPNIKLPKNLVLWKMEK